MKNLIILIIAILTSIISFAQENGIYLINKTKNDSILLQEHKRIKISTIDGKTIVGKFTIIDNTTIMIKGQEIALDSIVKIQRASIFNIIAIIYGSSFVLAGIGSTNQKSIIYDKNGFLLIPVGVTILTSIFLKNNHKSEKWNYKIQKQSQ